MLINCPHCAKQLDAGPEKHGQVGTCPHCKSRFMVPLPTAEVSAQQNLDDPLVFTRQPTESFPQGSILFEQQPVVTHCELEPAPRQGKLHVITERTSKRYKAIQIVGILLFVFGLASEASVRGNGSVHDSSTSYALASLVTFSGIVIFIVGRVQAWWHHG